ncbi:hypothetical protein U91I_02892 [alpha proteobacterium U9-1i]|nr:hypothetical protein U91I_02892 [alpha proteobacterium U9-1i]
MSLDAAQRKALKALCGKRGKPELKRLFALIRAHNDRSLFAALAPARNPKSARDTLAGELARTLSPLVAPAAEKAELLVEHLARKHRRKLKLAPKGLAHATRALRTHFTDAQIRTGAESLMKDLAKLYDARETVV